MRGRLYQRRLSVETTQQPSPAGEGPQVVGVAAQEGEGAMAAVEEPVQPPCKPYTF